MFQNIYYIDKINNTFADNLAAFGLGYVLNNIANGRSKVQLEDKGYSYAANCEPSLREEWVDQCQFFTGAPFLITVDKKTQRKMIKGTSLSTADLPESGETVADYQFEKGIRDQFNDWLFALSREDRKKAFHGELQGPNAPHIHWDIFRAINPNALQGYNSVIAEWWLGKHAFPDLLKILLNMTSQSPNDLNAAEESWTRLCEEHGRKSKPASLMQLFNPSQGKGINSAKTVWSSPNNLKGFWLLEWLKVAGLLHGGITRIVANPSDPRNAKDRKTYVLIPHQLAWNRHQLVMKDFRRSMLGSATAIKLDILVALRYTQAFLKHFEGARAENLAAELLGERPCDLVSGMQMAFYKNLGNSAATMNIASINLPRWVAPQSPEGLAQLQLALDEHLSIVVGLDENRGGQFEMLNRYRDFLSANDLDPFFDFTTAYSGFIISQRERGKFVRQFSTTTLEVLFMNSDDNRQIYCQIVQDEGFRNLAYAIRHSTVVPQSMKGRGKKPLVDVRYGLGQQLARKAAYPGEFLAELSEFLHLYNAENAQLREKGRNPFRKNITTADIEAVTSLVDQFGSKVVCNMLVAYGYAREPYEREAEGAPAEEVIIQESETSEEESQDE